VPEAGEKAKAARSYDPPIAAILGIVATIILTIWQVNKYIPNAGAVDYGIRLFFWVIVGVLVALLMYSRKNSQRSPQVKNIGLLLSLINLVVWVGITYWFFAHFAEMRGH
jgi:peptidoglycan/LPS O-acetylase OafA/YrhL